MKRKNHFKGDGYTQLTFKKKHGFNTFVCKDCGAYGETKKQISHFIACIREVRYAKGQVTNRTNAKSG